MRTFTGPCESQPKRAVQRDDAVAVAFGSDAPTSGPLCSALPDPVWSPPPGSPDAVLGLTPPSTQGWAGRSGRLYQAVVIDLMACRAPARAAYVLARRDAIGRAHALFAGLALSAAPTVNLARIRQRAARLGAGEVHLIDLTHSTGTLAGRRLVRDVRAGLADVR